MQAWLDQPPGFWIALLALLTSAVSLAAFIYALKREHRRRTMEYVSAQFDRLATMGARAEIAKVGSTEILTYLEAHPASRQLLLEYVYTFNRIGAGVREGALSERVLFRVWPPSWFMRHWKRFAQLIEQERKQEGRQAFGSPFEWLVREKCQKDAIRRKYD